MKKLTYGFTLIELMIVVAIIGILGSIAVPQYGSYMLKSRRADAHVALHIGAQTMERCRTESGFSYKTCSVSGDSAAGHYSLYTDNPTDTTFTIVAVPMSDGPQANDTECNEFSLDAQGNTSVSGTGSVTDCW